MFGKKKYIPIKVPDVLNNTILSLETQGKDADRWPKTTKEVEQFAEKLNQCIKDTPPWAEKELLPRFNLLRWEDAAFRIIISDPKTLDIAYCNDIQEVQVDGIPQKLLDKVKEVTKNAEIDIKKSRKMEVIQSAKNAILNENADRSNTLFIYLCSQNHQYRVLYHSRYQRIQVVQSSELLADQYDHHY